MSDATINPREGDVLLSVAESREIVPLSARQLQRKAGVDIPCVRLGPKSLRFWRSDLLRYLETCTEGASK